MEDINVGEKVKEFRLARAMSLRELADRTKLSPSMISQIENNTANPSINALKSIAFELNIPLYKFFQNEDVPDNLVVRKDEYKVIGKVDAEVQYKLLTQDVSGTLEVCLMDIPAGKSSSDGEYGHAGEEVAFIIYGETDVYLNNTKYHLQEGDAIKIPPMTAHRWVNTSDSEVRVIFAVTPPSF